MISADGAEGSEYDNWNNAKSRVAGMGVASLWASGEPESIARGKQIYDVEKTRQGKQAELKRMMNSGPSN